MSTPLPKAQPEEADCGGGGMGGAAARVGISTCWGGARGLALFATKLGVERKRASSNVAFQVAVRVYLPDQEDRAHFIEHFICLIYSFQQRRHMAGWPQSVPLLRQKYQSRSGHQNTSSSLLSIS